MASENSRQTRSQGGSNLHGARNATEIEGRHDCKLSQEITVDDFLRNIKLTSCSEIFSGLSCRELILMSRTELRRKMQSRPRGVLDQLNEGIYELRKLHFSDALQHNLPDGFPNLEEFLTKNGVPRWVWKDKSLDMRKFLDWPESDWKTFSVYSSSYKQELSDCRHSLFTLLLRDMSCGPEKRQVEDNRAEKERQLKLFLKDIFMERLLSFFIERNMSLNSVLSFSDPGQLRNIGMDELDATQFIRKKNLALKDYSTLTSSSPITKSKVEQDNTKFENTENPPTYSDVARQSTIPLEKKSEDCVSQRERTISSGRGRGQAPSIFSSTGPTPFQNLHSEPTETNISRISAEDFLKRHNFTLPEKSNPGGHQLYSEELSDMDESECRKLMFMSLDSNRELSSKVDELKAQLKFSPGYSSPVLDQKDVEMLDVSNTAPPGSQDVNYHNAGQSASNSLSNNSSPNMAASRQPYQALVPFVPRKALNILLLGETGVGKSTFINAFANYVNHETLGEGRKKKMIALIPASFSVSDDNYEDHKVSIGQENGSKLANESLEQSGQSSTQTCKSYVFPSKNGAIRIIDTPGVGDTRGLDQDSLNFDNILTYLSQFPELHAICILLKPNNAKLTAGFRVCLNQLLSNLEKSASRNIIFLFTNARSTFYQPGDTKPVLEEVLREISNNPPYIKIKFDQSTSYCVDNESFRFLAAISNGLDFLEADFETFDESWTASVNECKRLMEYILTLEPHKIHNTVSISEARRLIDELGSPVADILLEIGMNLSRFMDRLQFLESNRDTQDLESLKGKLKTKVTKMVYKQLEYPRTVCASEWCIIHCSDGNVNYPQICHDKCYLTYQASERIGDPNLERCAAFVDGNCTSCRFKCSWKFHMRISRIKFFEESEEEDMGIKALLHKATTIGEVIQNLQSNAENYKKERKLLLDTMAFFTVFQSVNSITGRGDPFRDCLQDHLTMEKYKSNAGAQNEKTVRNLEMCIKNYEATKSKLISGVESKECMKMTPDNVFRYEQVLYELKIHGPRLQKRREAIQKDRVKDLVSTSEEVVDLKPYDGATTTSILQPVDSFFANK